MIALRHRALAVAVLLIALADPAAAQPSTAGTPVATTHLGDELNPSIVADGQGGAFVGFKLPYRSASLPPDIVVSHLLTTAVPDPSWTALPMTPLGALPQTNPPGAAHVLPAPGGHALAFADFGNSSGTVDFIREAAPGGADPSYPGFKPSYDYNVFTAIPRSGGGVLVLSKAQGTTNVLATIVNATGVGTEILNPIAVGNGSYSTVANDRIATVPCGPNGVIAVMQFPQIFNSLTGADLIAVRLDANGQAVWAPSHRVISAANKDQWEVVAATDGADGALIAWRDQRNTLTGSDIYAERLLPAGTVATGWAAGGKSICGAAGEQTGPSMVSDDAGGAWLAWVDGRDTTGTHIYYTHLLGNGTIAAGFPAGGKALCTAAGSQTNVQLARDDSGGCFAVWLDSRDGEVDLYGQHVDSAGSPTAGWVANGSPLCTDPTAQGSPAVALVSPGRAIVVWNDSRSSSLRVYALLIGATPGVLDAPPSEAPRLALATRANPSRGGVELRLDSAAAGDIRVTLYDVGGRALAERTVAGPARSDAVRFEGLPPGLYFAVAGQRGAVASARVAVFR